MPAAVILNIARFQAAATGQQFDQYAERVAKQINSVALVVYEARQRHDNEWRTSRTTPPHYADSFRVRKEKRGEWRAENTDPGAVWVEFGAHAGGRTFVLGYRPYGVALTIVGATHA